MPVPLARLRGDLDFMPSPVEDRPGLLIRDSFRYSDAILIIPPVLVACLECFDGERTEADLREALFRITGELEVGGLVKQLKDALAMNGFLEDENFHSMKRAREEEFVKSAVRQPAHAGSAYPARVDELRQTLDGWMGRAQDLGQESDGLLGIAAPHVSPSGGYASYQAAYQRLRPEYADRIFVVLGTSHYGAPNRFGITRKPYATPFGETLAAEALADELIRKAPDAISVEDYCHSFEHSIEFQVLFLQSIYGPSIRVLPILCGPYAARIHSGGLPEHDDGVARFLGALGEIAARESDGLFWVLGIDMAHMGRRYGDEAAARANEDGMLRVAERDRQRIHRAALGDARGFWELVQENGDDLKWCGSSALYTFLRAVPAARGAIEKYEQWNIDPHSVVSFAGMSFRS